MRLSMSPLGKPFLETPPFESKIDPTDLPTADTIQLFTLNQLRVLRASLQQSQGNNNKSQTGEWSIRHFQLLGAVNELIKSREQSKLGLDNLQEMDQAELQRQLVELRKRQTSATLPEHWSPSMDGARLTALQAEWDRRNPR